jgi:hypothetical protein
MVDFEMCRDCAGLVGAGHEASPHPKMVLDGANQEFEARGTRADGQPFVCTTCGQRWIHETGTSGYGWIVSAS